MVKAYEGAEQADVGLCELVPSNVPLAAENALCLVQGLKHFPAYQEKQLMQGSSRQCSGTDPASHTLPERSSGADHMATV